MHILKAFATHSFYYGISKQIASYSLGSCKAMHLKYNITITNCLTFQPNIVLHWAVFKTKSRVKYSKCVCVNQWFIHGAVWGLETERVCSSLCEVELDVWKWDYMWCLNNKGQWLSIGRKPERICHSKSQLR